jgi:hypothetical protein
MKSRREKGAQHICRISRRILEFPCRKNQRKVPNVYFVLRRTFGLPLLSPHLANGTCQYGQANNDLHLEHCRKVSFIKRHNNIRDQSDQILAELQPHLQPHGRTFWLIISPHGPHHTTSFIPLL